MSESGPYNPLDKGNLGKSVAEALLVTEERPLANVPRFPGAGVYAIYYRGSFAPYKPLSDLNREAGRCPIYVGKAVPKGGRKGGSIDSSMDSTALSLRLMEHASSVNAVPSLDIKDFTFQCLVVDEIWIGLGETMLIQLFRPLWNQVVDGFGNHNPGAGRHAGRRPLWDMLHPGRPWAMKCQAPSVKIETLLEHINKHMSGLVESR